MNELNHFLIISPQSEIHSGRQSGPVCPDGKTKRSPLIRKVAQTVPTAVLTKMLGF